MNLHIGEVQYQYIGILVKYQYRHILTQIWKLSLEVKVDAINNVKRPYFLYDYTTDYSVYFGIS